MRRTAGGFSTKLLRGLPLALLVSLLVAGCARMMHSYDLAPNGLTRTEDRWRAMLATGRADSAAVRLARGGSEAPGDSLLRLLYLGTTAHYSGSYEKSNQYLEAAAELSDDRITKSLSRSALSLISNDGTLAYTPARSERLLIPYYAALNYIALGQMEDAAVEARRLSALLQAETTSKSSADPSDDARNLRATMRSFTGAVFEAMGNRNDALVAYRNAAALGAKVDTLPLFGGLNSADSSGTVVVLLEDGFIAHRIEQNLFVWLGPDELHAFSTGGAEDRAQTASSIGSRVAREAFDPDQRWRGRGRGDFYVPLPADLQRSHHPRNPACNTERDDNGDHGRDEGGDRTDRGHDGPGIAPGQRTDVPHDGGSAHNGGAPSITDALKRNAASRTAASNNTKDTASTRSAKTDSTKTESGTKSESGTKPARATSARAQSNTRAQRNHDCEEEDVPYLLKVAWPAYSEASAPQQAYVVAGVDTVSTHFADLSGAVVHDYNSQLPLIVARTVARGAAKAALTQRAKRKASETNEGLGKLIGMLGNVGNVMLERADTRSWHLLPAGIAVVRVHVPAGALRMSVTLPGRAAVDLGMVNVGAGKLAFVSRRAY